MTTATIAQYLTEPKVDGQKWEYAVLYYSKVPNYTGSRITHEFRFDEINREINEMAQHGWEILDHYGPLGNVENGLVTFIFKRRTS